MEKRNYLFLVYSVFLAVALVIFTFSIPPFRKFDETGHFLRVMTIASGQFTCKADAADSNPHFTLPRPVFAFVSMFANRITEKFPVSLYKQSYPYQGVTQTEKMFDECYLPYMGYLPQTLGAIASTPWNNLLVTFYFTRIAAAIFFLICFILSLWLSPKRYQLVLLFVGALPTILHQVTIVSYDATTISLSFLVFSLFTRYLETKKIHLTSFVLFCLVILYLVSSKPGYYFFALLPLFLISKINIPIKKSILLATAILCYILGFIYFAHLRLEQLGDSMYLRYQISVSDPKYFLSVLYNTVTMLQEKYVSGIFTTLGWFEYDLPISVFVIYIGLAGFIAHRTMAGEKKQMSPGWALGLFGIVIGSVVLLFYLFFVYATPIGQSYISGIQGRYFLPFILIGYLAVSQIVINLGKRRAVFIGLCVIVVYLLYAMTNTIYHRYYDYTGLVARDPAAEQSVESPGVYHLDVPTQHDYPVPAGNKIGGFQMMLANEKNSTVSAVYRYAIKDSSCNVTYYEGYLDQEKTQGTGIYTEYFYPIPVREKSVCMEIAAIPMKHLPVFLTVASDKKNVPIIHFLYQLK